MFAAQLKQEKMVFCWANNGEKPGEEIAVS